MFFECVLVDVLPFFSTVPPVFSAILSFSVAAMVTISIPAWRQNAFSFPKSAFFYAPVCAFESGAGDVVSGMRSECVENNKNNNITGVIGSFCR